MDVYVSRVRSRPLVVVDDFALWKVLLGKEREEMSASERVRKEVCFDKNSNREEKRDRHTFLLNM